MQLAVIVDNLPYLLWTMAYNLLMLAFFLAAEVLVHWFEVPVRRILTLDPCRMPHALPHARTAFRAPILVACRLSAESTRSRASITIEVEGHRGFESACCSARARIHGTASLTP